MNELLTKFRIPLAAFICAVVSNIELLYLNNHEVKSLFVSSLFDVNIFLEEKQFLVVINILFAFTLSCYMCSKEVVNYYTIYTFNRIPCKTTFFIKRMSLIAVKQVVFSAIYCFTILALCCISCRELFDINCLLIVLKSILALTYACTFFSIICSTITLFFDERIAVLITMITTLILTYITITFSDFFSNVQMLVIINPITTATITEHHSPISLMIDCILLILVLLIEALILTYVCKRKEFH